MALCSKIHKLRQTKFSQFVYFSLVLREREETKPNIPHLITFRRTFFKEYAPFYDEINLIGTQFRTLRVKTSLPN